MAFVKGKKRGISELLEGYEKLNKAEIAPEEGILIDNVIKGTSQDNGDFVYVTGTYNSKPVYTAIPAASLDNFLGITAEDLEEIRSSGLKLYVESKVSKIGRQYFIAWIDE